MNWLVTAVLNWVVSKLDDLFVLVVRWWTQSQERKERERLQEEAKKKLDEVKANPNATKEEIESAYAEYINSGRK